MNCIEQIDGIARRLLAVIEKQQGVRAIQTEDFGWENYRFDSAKFRLAHVEIFNQNKFSVVHCCIFPHISDPSPIFGFDVIAGENKITGVFMDLSPTVLPSKPFTTIAVEKSRDRPDWGSIFSEHWLACRPTQAEMAQIGDEAVRVLENYLPTLGGVGLIHDIKKAQNRYCLNQQQNEHTRKALVALLGDAGADRFMSEILFPTVT
jgi:phycocyanobilin:ferredoxin oxidoreductase